MSETAMPTRLAGYESSSGCAVVEISHHVAHGRLNRPERRNALDMAMIEALGAVGPALCAILDLRAIVLSGEGRGFCGGIDLGVLAEERERKPAPSHSTCNKRSRKAPETFRRLGRSDREIRVIDFDGAGRRGRQAIRIRSREDAG